VQVDPTEAGLLALLGRGRRGRDLDLLVLDLHGRDPLADFDQEIFVFTRVWIVLLPSPAGNVAFDEDLAVAEEPNRVQSVRNYFRLDLALDAERRRLLAQGQLDRDFLSHLPLPPLFPQN